MEVHLLIYDLSQGLAKQMSQGFLGFQLDAIYHTSIELSGREYVYDGGIVDIVPGTSHLGRPLQRLKLGVTELPVDVIEQFIDSMKPVFTAQAYDLWKHNCNNWSDTFAKFLLGTGIPEHIINMPQTVLDSPIGRMLMPQLNIAVNSSRGNGSILGIQGNGASSSNGTQSHSAPTTSVSKIKIANNLRELDAALDSARSTSAVIFFTSVTCGPCKMYYRPFEEMAAQYEGKVVFIQVDTSRSMDIASRYEVRATPTFMTFLRGEKQTQWSGGGLPSLQSRIQTLALSAHPQHPHERLDLPSFSNPNGKPVLYAKAPPMPKLLAKMGDSAADPAVQAVKHFIESRASSGAAQAVLPDMHQLAGFIQRSAQTLSPDVLFSVVDLFRCALVDPRVSGCFAEESGHETVAGLLETVNGNAACPYALRLVTLQMACNLFSTPLYADPVLHHERLGGSVIQLISTSFLDDSHNNVRVAASSLMFNVALANGQARARGAEGLPEGEQIELAASVLEAIGQEEGSPEALQGMLLALGHLVYCTPLDGELADLLRTMDAEDTVIGKRAHFAGEKLVTEVGATLLGKGLQRG